MTHLQQCEDCTREYERLQALRARLLAARVPMPRSLPYRVRTRIALEADEQARQERHSVPTSRAAWWARFAASTHPYLRQAAVVLLACGISAGAAMWWANARVDRDLIARDVVSAHVRALLQDSPVQVASLDTHTVKPWFAGRLDYTPVVKDLSAEGFRLVGGRLDYVGGQRVASLVYAHGKHLVSVFVWPGKQEAAPAAMAPQGYNIVSWNRAGMTYWAISDLSRSELEQLPPLL
jgi:anti-sigma factor RsiW